MIKIAGAEIASHGTEWGFGWDEPSGALVRIPAADEAEARKLAGWAGGQVFTRAFFETEWSDAADDQSS